MKKLLTHLPFTIGYIIAAIVLAIYFGFGSMAQEITASVKDGLEKDLITIEKEEPVENAVAEKGDSSANTTQGAGDSSTSASQGGAAENSTPAGGTDSAAPVTGSSVAQASETRGSCEYAYDPASASTGDTNADLILQTENAPEAYADALDQFGNVKEGAASPAGNFTYQPETGVNTAFLSYPPTPVESKFYQDPGEYTFTTAADYKTVDDTYFQDALFIGDSRTVGMFDYGDLPADFFCDRGYCTQLFVKEKPSTLQNTGAEMTLETCLAAKQYGKVYIILGINDSGYGTREAFAERYKKMVDTVKAAQPNAIIYLCANMYFASTFEDKLGVMNNTAVRDKNYAIAQCADGQTTFYLNYNGMFCGADGFLRQELTTDGAHLLGRYYAMWCNYFRHHAIVK